jgi:hypothetical protein
MNRLFNHDQEVVVRIHQQLARLAEVTRSVPDPHTPDQLATFIETAFWASLELNEGRQTRFRATLAGPDQIPPANRFADPVPYEERRIAKIAPATPPGGCLGVSAVGDRFQIWGFGGHSSRYHISIDVSKPGSLRVGIGPLQPFALLNGRQNPTLRGTSITLAAELQTLLGKGAGASQDPLETQAIFHECLALVELIRTVLRDGHGGTLLIVPSETGAWEKFLTFAHRFDQSDTTIHEAIWQEVNDQSSHASIQAELSDRLSKIGAEVEMKLVEALPERRALDFARVVRATSSLAAVDGAVVITRDLSVVGFGARITTPGDAPCRVVIVHPTQGEEPSFVSDRLEDTGGMRHQSATRFVCANNDTIALVISQDGHVSLFRWDAPANVVLMAPWHGMVGMSARWHK